MAERLDEFGAPVTVEGITLRTPGLTGAATVHYGGGPDMRSIELSTGELDGAFRSEGLQEVATIELSDTREVDVSGVATRSTSAGEPAIEVDVPAPGDEYGQAVLYADESGVLTWNFAVDEHDRPVTRGGEVRTYVVRRRTAPIEGDGGSRGLIGMAGKKLLKVVAFPLLDKIGARVGDYFAGRWEQAKRPYILRTFGADDYAQPPTAGLGESDWQRLGEGRALMFVHGTFSQSHTGFGALPKEFIEEVHRAYSGRVVAFDHFTLSHDPLRNVKELAERIPEGADLELDIICHSRGGLVSRVLAEKQGELSLGSKKLSINKVVFVATPNAGTILADAEHLNDLIDSYTNLLNFVPDVGVTDVLETILTVVKQLAVGTLKGLEGLRSMDPDASFLKEWLNVRAASAPAYFALASNYEPPVAGWATFKDAVLDAIFGNQNDLVVPTEGVYADNGSGAFPIANSLVFAEQEGVAHSGFFANEKARQHILDCLKS